MTPVPIALPPALPSELLTYVLGYLSFPITLIICQPRSTFMSSLLSSVTCSAEGHIPDAAASSTEQYPSTPVPEPPRPHPLLVPTLRQIGSSRYINMVFLNTVTHLRAYLAAFPPPETDKGYPEARPEPNKSEKKVPLIIVYGLLELHRDTSEWSVQGLGSSIAVLVEAGWRAGQRIEVLEEKVGREEQHGESEQPQSVLEERLPMLNGNVRRAGLEGEDAVWSGRTVEVRRVLGRWFWFGKGYW